MCNAQSKIRYQPICAAICRADGRLDLTDVDIESPREDELLVRLVATGICHTDLDYCDAKAHSVLGHEGAGVVAQVGAAVRGFDRGDHVLMSYNSCGGCEACRQQQPAHCAYFMPLNFSFARLDGSSAYRVAGVQGHFFGQSSFASYSIVNARNLVKVDRSLPLDILAPLGCGLQTGAGTVINSLGLEGGGGIVIFGAGSVGLAAVMAAKVKKASRIVVVDRIPERLKLALELGATEVIDSQSQEVAKRLAEIAGACTCADTGASGAAGFDYAIDSTGDAELINSGLAQLKPTGRMALLTGGEVQDSRAFGVIQGDAVPQTFIPYLIRLWQTGDFPIERLLHHYPFSDINRAFADVEAGRVIKAVLRWE